MHKRCSGHDAATAYELDSDFQASTTYLPFVPTHKVQPKDLREYEIPSRCERPKISSLGDALLVSKFLLALTSAAPLNHLIAVLVFA